MTDDSSESTIREHARFLVALGRHGYADIVRQCLEILDPPYDESEPLARRLVADEFAAHLADQRTWPDELDTDRLNRALRELDESGIVARLDHTCCQSCGISEIGDEVPDGEDRRGYVFAHRQDMQAAVPGGVLTLAYGVFCEGEQPPEAQTGIGAEAAAALRRHGLDVDWNGSPRTRIDVSLDWKRRRYGSLADHPDGSAPDAPDPHLVTSFCDYRTGHHQDGRVPVSIPEARDIVLATTPYDGNFFNFGSRSGKALIAIWESGPRLWMENPATGDGRNVTVAEADEFIDVLGREDRVALT